MAVKTEKDWEVYRNSEDGKKNIREWATLGVPEGVVKEHFLADGRVRLENSPPDLVERVVNSITGLRQAALSRKKWWQFWR